MSNDNDINTAGFVTVTPKKYISPALTINACNNAIVKNVIPLPK